MAITTDFIVKNGLIVKEDAVINGITVGTGGVATNTIVGENALSSNVSGTNNIVLGGNAGQLLTGSNNVIIGSFTGNQGDLDITTSDNFIVIADGQGNRRIVVDDLGNVGINNSSPQSELDVTGTITATEVSTSVLTTTTFQTGSDVIVGGTLTVTGGLTTLNGDLEVRGNINAIGDITFEDPIIVLNSDLSSLVSPTENSGVEVNRGLEPNVSFYWDETLDYWTTGDDPNVAGKKATLEAHIDGGSF